MQAPQPSPPLKKFFLDQPGDMHALGLALCSKVITEGIQGTLCGARDQT